MKLYLPKKHKYVSIKAEAQAVPTSPRAREPARLHELTSLLEPIPEFALFAVKVIYNY